MRGKIHHLHFSSGALTVPVKLGPVSMVVWAHQSEPSDLILAQYPGLH